MSLLPSRRWLRGPARGVYRAEHRQGEHAHAATWRTIWATTAEGCGLAHEVAVAAGVTAVVPPLRRVIDPPDGSPTVLVVELLRGQLVDDVRAVAERLALALDAAVVTVEPCGGRTVALVLHDVDPLAEPFRVRLPRLTSARESLVLGRAEDGTVLRHCLAEPGHIAIQGQNGAGKSRLTYALLGQVAHADDVIVAGTDVHGLALGRAWDGTRHREWQAAGGPVADHADMLDALVAEMDRRLAAMPRGVDHLDPSPALPLLLVVCEEFPGLLRQATAAGKPTAERVKLATLRLLAEGRKVAVRVLTLAQRAEADAMAGGYARDQYALTVSFRVPADSLVMLHGEDARALGHAHRTAEPAVAVVGSPGHELTRMRAPHVGDYGSYCDTITAPAPLVGPAGSWSARADAAMAADALSSGPVTSVDDELAPAPSPRVAS